MKRAGRNLERILKAVDSGLARRRGKGRAPLLRSFAAAFFARGVADDLARYRPADLAALAEAACGFASERRPGRHKIRIFDLASDDTAADTVIEIVNDDMPFLVDSVLGLLTELGIELELVLHPVLPVRRGPDGKLEAIADQADANAPGVIRESFIHLHLSRPLGAEQRAQIEKQISAILDDVRIVVLDWQPMLDRVRAVISGFQTNPPPVPVAELAESIQFLDWLVDNHFTLLGMREYEFVGGSKRGELNAVEGSGLGLLRDPEVQVLRRAGQLASITPEVRDFLMQPSPLIITKANVKATVHRRVYMDYIGIKRFDSDGTLTGEVRVIGLFTSTAYTRSPRQIPLLRRKIAYAIEKSRFNPDGHSGKALLNVLESYPRDELFQIEPETLLETAIGILQLEERPRVRVFARRDKFDRFVSVLVFVPRDRFNTSVRVRIGEHLATVYDGRVSAFYPDFPEGALVRIHYIIGRNETPTPQPDIAEIEAAISAIVRTWEDHLEDGIAERFPAPIRQTIVESYRDGFSPAYQETFSTAEALDDIEHIEQLRTEGDLTTDFYRMDADPPDTMRLRLCHLGTPIALSDRLPIVEDTGLRAINERSFQVDRKRNGRTEEIWLHDIVLRTANRSPVDVAEVRDALEACYMAIWRGAAESDGFNALVLLQRIGWRDVTVLRMVAKYLRQAGIAFSNEYMWTTLTKHSGVARLLVELFHVRFDPAYDKPRAAAEKRIRTQIERALEAVAILDEDRILRRFTNLISVTLRTNFFQPDADGGARPAIAIKIDSHRVDSLPEPRPFVEIFVYSPDVEGVHLRGGKIARGGLRWSDRPEDFRTEVLGLVKAQQVKNAVIVPVGAKGGFVPKKLPLDAGREAVQAEAVRCYRIFVSSLLDVTDNLEGEKVIPPLEVVRHDDDDPYLVVAADKGTATFSDIANDISESRGFWLADAFASGGSAGYDHKKMGITARGGWEAVKRHFRELDIDIQTTPFTVIGCGDMSGDVFGNGMLLSKQIRLLAAFDHRDIFIDPNPDPATGWAERKRLFDLPRSSWQDYSAKAISKGGGVFSRSLKAIPLTDQIRELTGLTAKQATPAELIRALLASPTDLLWFGGIGTYVRASDESDEDVGDRANDALRVSAAEVSARVIGEGANLGVTQRGRIEFALAGGRINTDAVDNSAGVNSSDVEVNIKIAVGSAERSGKLTRKARNKLLVDMTEEVASLVLRNNYQQTLSLTLTQARGMDEFGYQARFMRELEQRGLLQRAIEYLPDDAALLEREAAGLPLTRPELAVLLAYAKLTLYDDLLASSVPDDAYLGRELFRYFPRRLQAKFPDEIAAHKLRREIIATMLANSMINRGGPTMISRLAAESGANVSEIAAAFAMARDSFDLTAFNGEIDALDARISAAVQTGLYLEVQDLTRRQTVWFLRNVPVLSGLEAQIAHYRGGIETLSRTIDAVLPPPILERIGQTESSLVGKGVPGPLAARVARLPQLARGPDIILVSTQTRRPIDVVARAFYAIGARLGVDRLADRADQVEVADYFDRLALGRSVEGVFVTHRSLAAEILRSANGRKDPLDAWVRDKGAALERTERAMSEMIDGGELTLAKVTVAGSYLQDLLAT